MLIVHIMKKKVLNKKLKLLVSKERNGQVIILAALALSGAILGATAIAGLLTVYQIRQAADFDDSARAIFAADTGIEWGQFQFYRPDLFIDQNGNLIPTAPVEPVMGNGTWFQTSCSNLNNGVPITANCIEASNVQFIRAIGHSAKTVRAFEVCLADNC